MHLYKEKHLISVIVPIYNVKDYIAKCIESIQKQTYKNIEILLVNDGTLDESRDICIEYAKRDGRIKIIDKQNGGLSSARNAGINEANGDYLCFVDGDDYLHPQYIERLYEIIVKNSSDLSVCGIEIVDANGKRTNILSNGQKYNEYIPFSEETLSSIEVERRYYEEAKSGFMYVVAWNKMYKKDIFKNLLFDVNVIYEDEFIFNKLLRKCKLISFTPDKLYYYVQRDGGITSKKKENDRFHFLTEIFDRRIQCYTEENNIELQRFCCVKYLKQIISNYCLLSKDEKYKVKQKYLEIVKSFRVPFKYKLFYPFLNILSVIKNKM